MALPRSSRCISLRLYVVVLLSVLIASITNFLLSSVTCPSRVNISSRTNFGPFIFAKDLNFPFECKV